ncbi:cell wall protein DAN4 [Biomphalaria pfeifferi]|uniref:Cell wall protein DAN4 n=1 Tax=Biomphalaria pfeifferi TaxID=112525 RepID=A0AAD8C883_BIOPF|nr:cell wall protein DAN4 [Biomphalaria pfeifferi]
MFGSILLQPRLQTDYDFWRSYLKSKKSYWVGGVKTETWKAHHWENTNIPMPRTYFNEYIFDEWLRWCVSFEPQYRLMDFSHTDIIGYAFECESCSIHKDIKDDMILDITINTNIKLETKVTDSQDNIMSKTTFEAATSTDYKLNDFSATVFSVTISNDNTVSYLDANTSFVVPNNINSMSVTRTSDNSLSVASITTNSMIMKPFSVSYMALTPSSVNDMALTPSSVNDMARTLSSNNDMALTPSNANMMSSTITPTLELSTSVVTPGITNENTLRASLTIFIDSKDTNTINAESPTILTELRSFRQNTIAATASIHPSLQQLVSIFSILLTSSSPTPKYTMDYAQVSILDSLPPYATIAASSANLTSCSTKAPYATKYAMAASSYFTATSETYTMITSRYLCHCKCSTQVPNQNYQTSLPRFRKQEILIEIKSRLHVDVKNSSTTIRRLTCAEDKRRSAQTVGSLSVIALVIVFGSIIVLDFSRLVQCVTRSQARSLKKKRRKMTKMNSG